MKTFKIGDKIVGEGYEPYIIAEVGINHNGNVNIAKQMIDVAKTVNVDAVKFQTFYAEDFISDRELTYTYKSQGKEVTESMFDMFKRVEFTRDEWHEIKTYCDSVGIEFLSTPATVDDANMLVDMGVKALKIGSDDFVNVPLIKAYSKYGLPLLLASGMSDGEEIKKSLEAADVDNNDVCLFLCTSQYPTPETDVNAKKLLTMAENFPNVVLGFSDHSQGSTAAILANGYGACIFEKHFTLDHEMPGPDHWFSANPQELKAWVEGIRQAYVMKGNAELEPTNAEKEMRVLCRRSVVALKDIHVGEVLDENNIGLRRPGNGISPYDWEKVIGHTAKNEIMNRSQLKWSDID